MPSAPQGCAAPASLPTGAAACSQCTHPTWLCTDSLLVTSQLHTPLCCQSVCLPACLPVCLPACLSTVSTVWYVLLYATVCVYWKCNTIVTQGLLGTEGLGFKPCALVGQPGTLWIGGTTSQKNSKHKQLKAAVPDGRFSPPHAVRTTTAAGPSNALCTYFLYC